MSKFQHDDIVRVISNCQAYGQIGRIIRYISCNSYCNSNYVQVRLTTGHIKNFNENSLVLENNTMIIKGDHNMITGNYNVAMVKFIQGTNTIKGYAFALFDDNIKIDDLVLCDTANGYGVAKVTDILPQDEYEGTSVTKEIICKVDFTDFEQRKTNREKAKKLKSEMDKKLKDLQEIALYELMAEKSPELKEMLEAYKSLI
jgi:hypothetical protein